MTGNHDSAYIRKAEHADLSALRGIVDILGFAKNIDYFERCLERAAQGTLDIFIVSLEGQDVGYCLLNWRPKYRFFQISDIPEIQDLNVVPDFRRCGLASILIRHCEEVVRSAQKPDIGISFGLTPEYGPAQKLYIKLGYMPDGHGMTYDRVVVEHGGLKPADDNLCLMLTKKLV